MRKFAVAVKRKCAWCDKDMGDKPPYEDDGVTHGICQECYKKYRKGHKLGCELLTACPYFNDDTYRMPGIFKEQYCRGEYRWCGRYMAFKAEERSKLPHSKLWGITGMGATLPQVTDEAAFIPPAS